MIRFLRQLFCRHEWESELLAGSLMGHGRLVRRCSRCQRFERREIYSYGTVMIFRRVDEARERRSTP